METRRSVRRRLTFLSMALVVPMALVMLVTAGPLAEAQEPTASPGDEPENSELRDAMMRFFETRLRAELALSDEQFDAVAPKLRELEAARQEHRRERANVIRDLRRGMAGGAGDAELQTLLDRWTELDLRGAEAERAHLGEIEADLSVRQRVELRFFTERFRDDMRRRLDTMRGEDRTPGGFERKGARPDRQR